MRMKRTPEVRVGISGWTYAPWRGVFYPRGLAQHRELAFASRKVRSIEINGTFYSLQRPESYAWWREQTPEDFTFSVKAPRFITHVKRLKDPVTPLANFFASGVLRLGEKLGPILWQLPPSFRFDPERLDFFLSKLPRTTREAAALSKKHDFRLKGRAWTETDADRPLRHALEIRHPSFAVPEFVSLLKKRRTALVVADTAGKWPLLEELTTDFMYVRLHGDKAIYVSGYTPRALERWAGKLRAWGKAGRDVYVYFDNDVKVRAPYDAMSLAHRLGKGLRPARFRRTRRPGSPRRTSGRARRSAAAARPPGSP